MNASRVNVADDPSANYGAMTGKSIETTPLAQKRRFSGISPFRIHTDKSGYFVNLPEHRKDIGGMIYSSDMKYVLTLLREQNPLLFYFGLVCGLFALGCLVLTQRSQIRVMGTNAWYKPFKFFLSTTIFVWSMGWYLRYLVDSQLAITAYSWGMIFLFTLEDGYIVIQAARGQRSHFNVSTPWYAVLYGLMAISAVAISVWTAYVGIRFFQQDLAMLPVAYKWSIRWGLLLFVIFSMEGLAMGSRLRHSIGGPDDGPGLPVVNWSTQYGDLRIAHFVGMHALQVVPLVGYYLLTSAWTAGLTALLYGSMATFLFVRALQAKPLFRFFSQPAY